MSFDKFIGTLISGDTGFRKTAMRVKIGKQIVDTVNSPDCGWETGIERNGIWIIVEEYGTEAEARKGHKKWCEKLKENPKVKLKDCRTAEEWFFG